MFMCRQGHVHGTQDGATNCYICKRRQARKSAKRARKEQDAEIAALLSGKTEAANNDEGERNG